ncbi:MAG: sigma-70 family RNA polymerase sigma factor [Clostridioides sp.]|nr:sigma-70 family RNA polymerase sigma factor [Clostridioides sp.]
MCALGEGSNGNNSSYDAVSNAMRMYLNDIESFEMLTPEEEVELAKQIMNSSITAKEKFINANYRLVVSIAKRYKRESIDLLDLIQAGNMGLIKAVDRYDYRKGFKFSTYATWWIKQSIIRHIDDCESTIRIPVHVQQKLNTISRKKREYITEFGREPSVKELAEYCDLEEERLIELNMNYKNIISLDNPIRENEDACLVEIIPSDGSVDLVSEAVEKKNLRENIDEILLVLSEQEQEVLKMRFGLHDQRPRTLEEIGKVYGVTRERIRQIESKAIKKLRATSKASYLENYY